MTERDANERLLRLNAALDGELDAMGSLEFERELRDDPASPPSISASRRCVTRSVVTRRARRRRKRLPTASRR